MIKDKDAAATLPERFTDFYIAALLSVFLLFPGFRGYTKFTVYKAVLFFLLSGVYLCGSLLLCLGGRSTGRGPRPDLRSLWEKANLPQKLIFVYWLLSLLSALCSPYRSTAFLGSARYEGLLTISLYCGTFLLVSSLGRPKKWMLYLFAAAFSINCIVALIQLSGFNPLSLYPDGMTYYDANVLYSGEYLGTIGNADLLSAVLCLVIAACWIALLKLRDKKRFLLLLPLMLSLIVLLRSYVEGGILGVFVGALLTVPVIAPRGRRKVPAITAGVLLLGCVLGVYFCGSRMGGFLYEASELMHGNWDDSFGSGRIYIWRNVLNAVQERPLLGGGPDTLGLRLNAVFERYDDARNLLLRSTIDVAHNEYLNILVNQGLPALLAYLAALVAAAVRWVKCAPENPAAAICGGAVLSFCIQAFFGIGSPISSPFFWLAFALLVRSLSDPKRPTVSQPQ